MARVTSSLRASGLSTHAANNSSHQQGPAKPNGQRKAAKASCYARQQRYREKQRLYVDRLEATVKRLRVDVDEHLTARPNAQRALVSDQLRALCGTDSRDSRKQPRTMSATEVVEIMRKCMEAFESGMHAHQEKVTETAMRDDVRYGELIGRDGILDQWRCFMLYFNSAAPILENCAYSVECLEQGTTVGHVSATLVVRLTHLGLAAVFPQALVDTHLRDKLLQGPMLRLPMAVCFHFDEQGKVCRYDPMVDFVAGLHAVLGDYEDVATALQSANIDASGQVSGDLPVQLGIGSCCDHHSHTVLDCSCRRSSSRLDKFSLAFLLSSN
jgi:hypothetical protein